VSFYSLGSALEEVLRCSEVILDRLENVHVMSLPHIYEKRRVVIIEYIVDGHVIKPCLEQELVSVIIDKVRQVYELDFLCLTFSDEGEESLLDSQALQILLNELVVIFEAFNC